MSPVDQKNYTPIDVYGFRKKHLFSTVEKGGKKSSQSFPALNLLLIASVITFVVSVSYAVQHTLLSTNSRASEDIQPVKVAYFPKKTIVTNIQTFPQEYNAEEIPADLVTDIRNTYGPLDSANKKNYVFDKIIRFYIYRDVLKEKALESPQTVPTNFADLVSQIPAMEKTITDTLITKDHIYSGLDDIIKERIAKFH